MAAKDPRFPQMGGTLGLLARRVGNFVSEVSESVTTPEMLREHLAQVRSARRGDNPREALALAQRDAEDLSVHPQTLAATAMASVHIVVLEYLAALDHEAPSMAVSANEEVEAARRQLDISAQQSQAPLVQLVKALQRLTANDAEACHDELRRLRSELKGVAHADRSEAQMYRHLVAALAHLQLQHRRRGLRELSKCRSYLDASWPCTELRARIAKLAVDGHLAASDTAAARRWLADLYDLKIGDHGPPPVESVDEVTWVNRLLLNLRIATVSGDLKESRAIARELLGTLKHETWRRWTSLHFARACLSLGSDWLTRAVPGETSTGTSAGWRTALEAIEQLPASGGPSAGSSVRRLLALRNHQKSSLIADKAGQSQAIKDLTELAIAQSGAERSESLWELCHLCLAAEQHDAEVMRLVTDELERNPECHHAELQLWAAVHEAPAESDDTAYRYHLALDTVAKATRSRPDAPGLDELSPLRNELRRTQILCSHAALLRARRAISGGDLARAEIEIVEALTHDPEIASGHALLSEIVQDSTEARIEDLLDRALELMRSAPNQLAGRDFTVFADIIPKLRAERERLIRPLTIAVMGEFSSGKSTFVNALVGREVAPMGVLPTTSTINRFRNGRAGAGPIAETAGFPC